MVENTKRRIRPDVRKLTQEQRDGIVRDLQHTDDPAWVIARRHGVSVSTVYRLNVIEDEEA